MENEHKTAPEEAAEDQAASPDRSGSVVGDDIDRDQRLP